MAYAGKKQGVISGSMMFKGKEYVEIFDHQHKYLYGEVDDLFIAYGAWVEYNVVDAPADHPRNCYQMAINIDQEVKQSRAPTTDQFGKQLMNVREFNKVDFFQYVPEGGQLTHKSAIQRDFTTDNYYNTYYGQVSMPRDSRNRLIEHQINSLDVMLNLIGSDRYVGHGPHWEVTHFINQGKQYSINGYLSIRGFVLRGPGGVVRNRRDVVIPPDALRPINYNGAPQPRRRPTPPVAPAPAPPAQSSWDDEIQTQKPASEAQNPPSRGLGSFGGAGFGAAAFKSTVREGGSQKPEGFGAINVSMETVEERPATRTFRFGSPAPVANPVSSSNSDNQRFSGFGNAGFASSFGKTDTTSFRESQEVPAQKTFAMSTGFGSGAPNRPFGGSAAPGVGLGAFGSSGAFSGAFGETASSGPRIGSFGSSSLAPRSFGGTAPSGSGRISGAGSGAFGQLEGAQGLVGKSTDSCPGFGTSSLAPKAFAQSGTSSGVQRSFGGVGGTSGASGPNSGSFGTSTSTGSGFGTNRESAAPSKSFGRPATPAAGFGASGRISGSFGAPSTPQAGFGASGEAPRSFGTLATPGPGFGASSTVPKSFGGPRSFGGAASTTAKNSLARSSELTFGNRSSILDNSDIEMPRLANQTQDTTMYQEPNNNKPANLDDSWGDEDDIQRPVLAPPPRSRGFGLPPQAKGLSKYNGNQRF